MQVNNAYWLSNNVAFVRTQAGFRKAVKKALPYRMPVNQISSAYPCLVVFYVSHRCGHEYLDFDAIHIKALQSLVWHDLKDRARLILNRCLRLKQ